MNMHQEQLEAIHDIRNLMERSSRFLGLSGLAGIIVGFIAITCTILVYLFLDLDSSETPYHSLVQTENGQMNADTLLSLLAIFGSVLLVSVLTGIYMSMRKVKKMGLPIWDTTAKRLLVNFAIPLLTGAIYCWILINQGHFALALPATLIFYGFALLNASKYTINDIRYLGVLEIVAGLLASFFVDYGLLFWALGFGVLHIVYGISIYFKYEK